MEAEGTRVADTGAKAEVGVAKKKATTEEEVRVARATEAVMEAVAEAEEKAEVVVVMAKVRDTGIRAVTRVSNTIRDVCAHILSMVCMKHAS